MKKHRLIIDASSVVRAAHYAGEDLDNGYKVTFEDKRVHINPASWCYDNFILSYRNLLDLTGIAPMDTILVLDGKNSRSLRQSIYPEYKAHRKPGAPELNKEFYDALDGIADEIKSLGGTVMVQDGMEADDVIAYLSTQLAGKKTIWSRDGDMLALRSTSVDVYLKDQMNPEIYASAPAQYVLLYKALVGDTSDGLPGAKGFGPKAFTDMVLKFGYEGCDVFLELLESRQLEELAEDVADFKPLQKVLDNQETVYASYLCAKFYPQRVNTSREPLTISMQIGEVTHERLREFQQTKKLAAPSDGAWIISELRKSPAVALDIETATPEESDTWCAAVLDSKKGGGKKVMVDVFGSRLCGMSLTFGRNMQHTVYMPVDHLECENWSNSAVLEIVAEIPEGVPVLIHNTAFELPVLFNEWGVWVDGAWDTALMKSYVDENTSMGLKFCSEHFFGYNQTSYEEVTQGRKMNQLTGTEVLEYACDDTIACAALWRRCLLTMELEKTLATFEKVELPAQYWVAETFVRGIDLDWDRLKELEAEDEAAYAKAWNLVRDYLFTVDWPGTKYVPFERTVAGIKAAFEQVTGSPLETRVRKEEKLLAEVRSQGCEELANILEEDGDVDEYLQRFFNGEPDFDPKKDAHLQSLMYDVMKLPIRFRTRVTDLQRKNGKREGSPQADASAVSHALKMDLDPECDEYACLLAIREMKAVLTRKQLYYTPYPLLKHWKDGKIHPQLGQCRTVTRRFAASNPNISQLPKRNEGLKVREIFKAPPGFVFVSADFSSQELALIAHCSQDANMLSCFVGDNLKDPHSITGASIAKMTGSEYADYDLFMQGLGKEPAVKQFRNLGKATNFATVYGAQPKKLGKLLIIPVEEAEVALKAKEAAYPGLVQWSLDKAAEVRAQGYTTTLMGGRRHLWHKISDPDKWVQMEAERQGGNHEIQGSGAEQTKLAINKMCAQGLFDKYVARFVWPVHDQVDILVATSDVIDFIPEMHKAMTQNYGGMPFDIKSEVSIGLTLGTLKKVGTSFDREKIEKVLAEVVG